MRPQRSHSHVIHPSIDSLVTRIGSVTEATPKTDVDALRAACRGKISSYPVADYLRTTTDVVVGRARYDAVALFGSVRAASA